MSLGFEGEIGRKGGKFLAQGGKFRKKRRNLFPRRGNLNKEADNGAQYGSNVLKSP